MPPIQVLFRGPMLFLNRNANISRAFIPNAETNPILGGGKSGTHPDGSTATQHFARLIKVDASDNIIDDPINLVGGTVSLRAPGGGQCGLAASFSIVTPLKQITNSSTGNKPLKPRREADQKFADHVACVVGFQGGELGATSPSNLKWWFAKDFNNHNVQREQLPLEVVWAPLASSAEVVVRVPQQPVQTIQLGGQVSKVYIYNFDDEKPTVPELKKVRECTAGNPLEDDDFKWIYEALEAPGDDMRAWADNKHLPAPLSTCDGQSFILPPPFFPRVSSCFLAGWAE